MTASIADVAGIIQGIGSLVAIGAAVWIYAKQYSDKKADDESETRAFVQAVRDEVETVWNDYDAVIRQTLLETEEGRPYVAFTPPLNDTMVIYRANPGRLGKVDDEELRKHIVAVKSSGALANAFSCRPIALASGLTGGGEHPTRLDITPFFAAGMDEGEALEAALNIVAIDVRRAFVVVNNISLARSDEEWIERDEDRRKMQSDLNQTLEAMNGLPIHILPTAKAAEQLIRARSELAAACFEASKSRDADGPGSPAYGAPWGKWGARLSDAAKILREEDNSFGDSVL
ncbi:hypothetical protein KCU90_g694, partial [Aureobasidium melanogenum]